MKHLTVWLSLVVVLSLAAMPAFCADNAKTVTGTWKCVAKSDQGSMEFELALTQKGTDVTGTASRADGSTDIQKGTFENGKLTLKLEADGGEYEIKGDLNGDKLTGTLSHSTGAKAAWEGTRAGSASASASKDSESKGIAGLWKGKSQAGDFTVEIKKDGDKLSGTITLGDGTALPLSNVSFADSTLKFSVSVGDGDYKVEGKLDGDKLSGNYTTPNGDKSAWEAVRG